MKFFLFVLCCIVITVGAYEFIHKSSPTPSHQVASQQVLNVSPTQEIPYSAESYIFVPYWSFTTKHLVLGSTDKPIYFGITVNSTGIDTTDPGYKSVGKFASVTPDNSQRLLALIMTDSQTNSTILQNTAVESHIIADTVALAQEDGFSGVVLDLETSGLFSDTLKNRINTFVKAFRQKTQQNNLTLGTALYGDTFFRVRPYDVTTIANNSDRIFIMAYDFTKARSNPGPNFPLDGYNTYGYDFKHMVADFSKSVPSHKLVVVFGMFGYDWPIDNQNRSTEDGTSLSDSEIQNSLISTCKYQNCLLHHDSESAESNITYQDGNTHHIVWFEDQTSVNKKIQYLNSQDIKSTGYWAYSYY